MIKVGQPSTTPQSRDLCDTMLNVNKDFYIKLFLIVLIFGQKLNIIDVDAPRADTVIVLSLSQVLPFFSEQKFPRFCEALSPCASMLITKIVFIQSETVKLFLK